MKRNDMTHELVRSLSKSEKRFFQLQSRTTDREQKNYLLVFDVLSSTKTYDGHVLLTGLKGKKMNLSYEKKYLQEQIMRSLRNFHTGLSSATILYDALRDIEVLFKKRLNTLCFARVRSAQAFAEQYENYPALLALIDYESKLISRTGDYEKLWNYRKEGYIKKTGALQACEQITHAECLVFEATVILQRKGSSASTEEKEKLRGIRAGLKRLLKDSRKSFLLEELCLIGLYLCTTINGGLKESYRYSRRTVGLYWKNEWQLHDRPGRFFASSINLVNRCILLGEYDEAWRWLEKTKNAMEDLRKPAIQEMYEELMPVIYSLAFRISAGRADFAKGLELAKEFDRFEKNISVPLRANTIISMRLHIARLHFGAAEYAKALQKLNQVINWKQTELQEDLVQFAYLFRLLVYYEMKKYELLENQLASVSRFFSSKWSANKKGALICKALHDVLHAKSKTAETTLLQQFKKRFRKHLRQEYMEHEYADFIRWVDATLGKGT
ncbi:MAG: Uncharacterized protein FD123_2401 [Bacteroidetes bacterium]|nr:MAG: Uncharacterized protein FD123_2401 [Bacteroidota bacterium]